MKQNVANLVVGRGSESVYDSVEKLGVGEDSVQTGLPSAELVDTCGRGEYHLAALAGEELGQLRQGCHR